MSYSFVKYKITNDTGPINLGNFNNRSDQLVINSRSLHNQSQITASTAILLLAIVIVIVVTFYIIFRRRFKKELKRIQNDF